MASVNSPAAGTSAGDVSPTAASGSGSTTNPKMRKRTKTGCLTCRKRRIKCGEERPTCANCLKSKRMCEGYNQRVVFKTPLEGWPNHPGVVSTLQYHNSMLPGSRNTGFRPLQSPTQPQETTLTTIQPRPLTHFDYNETGPALGPMTPQHGFAGGMQPYGQDASFQQPLPSPRHQQPLPSPHHQVPTPTSAISYFPQPSPVQTSFHNQYSQEPSSGYEEQHQYSQAPYQNVPAPYDTHIDQKPAIPPASQEQAYYPPRHGTTNRLVEQNPYASRSSISPQAGEFPSQMLDNKSSLHRYGSQSQAPTRQPPVTTADFSQAGAYNPPLSVSLTNSSHSNFSPVQIPQHDVTSDVKYMHQHAVYEQPVAISHAQENQPQIQLSGFGGEDHISPTQVLDEAAVEEVDDDYWDVRSDEEMPDKVDERDEDAIILSRDFSLIRRIHFENTSELAIRRYDSFIYEGILSQYKAEQVANPLKNPKTARVFAHYIHVTGPSLSIYERNPRNPTSIFEGPTPYSQQSLHTYILPLKALNNQGLLHSQLALASLHIARLQRASVTPSYKHYAYALKRLGRSLGNPKKRHSIATLATSLLLAYYEVMSAEHVKWGTHLVGSAQLIAELDFPSLTQEARRLKAAQTARESNFPYQNPSMLIDQKQLDQRLKESITMPDENLVSTIVGQTVRYDHYGKVFEDVDMNKDRRHGFHGKLDARTFETLEDLYWFYLRQDAFQSMVSGNPLITPYRKWADCPPRAPLGRNDALYGTHDHIILLIGRISDFAVRDRERKIRQVDANGGQWRPRPGMPGMPTGPPPASGGQPPTPTTPMGPPPHMRSMGGHNVDPPAGQTQAPGQRPPQGAPPANAGPGFYGMAPARPPVPLSASYANPDYLSKHPSPKTPGSPHSKFADLPAAYEAALSEWNNISHAHTTIAHHLANTDSFAPLTPDLYPVAPGGNMTPFGPALVHRSYDISTLWTLLHLSNILLLRSHPAMPPAAMIAAGVCAPATKPYATLIGRIAAGMQVPASDNTPLSPFLGAALVEVTMALFFAGVQYQAPDQRAWLIKHLLNIDRRTGWATAAVIARSCETSWEKAAELGRGPPYDRRLTRRFGEEGPVAFDDERPGVGRGTTRDDTEPMEMGGVGGEEGDGERGFVVGRKAIRAPPPWAKNLLATDEDLRVDMERVGLGQW